MVFCTLGRSIITPRQRKIKNVVITNALSALWKDPNTIQIIICTSWLKYVLNNNNIQLNVWILKGMLMQQKVLRKAFHKSVEFFRKTMSSRLYTCKSHRTMMISVYIFLQLIKSWKHWKTNKNILPGFSFKALLLFAPVLDVLREI